MSVVKARVILFIIFFLGLVLQVVAIQVAFSKDHIYAAERFNLIFILVQVYSVHLAIVIGGIFNASLPRSRRAESTPIYLFVIAVLLVLAWNGFLVWPSIAFGFMSRGTDTDLAEQFTQVSTYSSWLLAGLLAFYFSKK